MESGNEGIQNWMSDDYLWIKMVSRWIVISIDEWMSQQEDKWMNGDKWFNEWKNPKIDVRKNE